eukprot:ANDGO_05028.mRNA.1 Superoxide dismutase
MSVTEYVVNQGLLDKLLANGGLEGISKDMLEQHFALYKGYVTNLNALRKELAEARSTDPATKSDRRRRLGFEMNGVVLHELYFANMTPKGAAKPASDAVKSAIAAAFGSFEAWEKEFRATGATRSIGWAVLYYDPSTGQFNNHFVQLHEDGNVAGCQPLVVMDVWEHAYILDYGATGRPKYIDSFFKNVDWEVVERRFQAATRGEIIKRN